MRMSCNGCRVLRKGCSEDCSIRPCLQWIKSPEAQANATVFLAKFYGRAGLMNLINAGPDNLRPAIFRSLLYEACGRIVNPIYGSVGLLWSGSWQMCQAAVEAVLKGAPIIQIPSETAANTPSPPLKAYDIRHVSKDEGKPTATAICNVAGGGKGFRLTDLHNVSKTSRTKLKRNGSGNSSVDRIKRTSNHVGESSSGGGSEADADVDGRDCQSRWHECYPDDCHGAPSHGSSASHESTDPATTAVPFCKNGSICQSASSEQMAEADPENHEDHRRPNTEVEVELELTLGLEPRPQGSIGPPSQPSPLKRCEERMDGWDSSSDLCRIDLGLDLTSR